jgi:hypothetical protein
MPAVAMPWKNKPAGAAPVAQVDPIKAKIDRLAVVKAALAPLKKEEEKLADEIKDRYPDAGDYAGTKCLARITVTPGERFDSKAFQADHPQLAAKYMKPTETVKLEIKPLLA